MKALFLTVLSGFLFIGSTFAGSVEKLIGLTCDFDKGEITIHVVTSGCTTKNDFTFEIKNDSLTVIRKKPDECKAMESVIQFAYSLKEAGINPNRPFVVVNRFIVNHFIAKIK